MEEALDSYLSVFLPPKGNTEEESMDVCKSKESETHPLTPSEAHCYGSVLSQTTAIMSVHPPKSLPFLLNLW